KNLAFDRDTTTYYDGPLASGTWVGLELDGVYELSGIRYYPRLGYGSRMLGGKFQACNTPDFTSGVIDLATITVSPSLEWNCIVINSSAHFKYIRYLGPTNGQGNVAEIEFYGAKIPNLAPQVAIISPDNNFSPTVPTRLKVTAEAHDPDGHISKVELYDETRKVGEDMTAPYEFEVNSDTSQIWSFIAKATDDMGEYAISDTIRVHAKQLICKVPGIPVRTFTALGTSGSYNNLGNTKENAFDKDTTSFFDGPNANSSWIGMDMGLSKNITGLRFIPREKNAKRMLNGRFQVANNATFTQGIINIDTINKVYEGEWHCITFEKSYYNRYVRYISPEGGYGNIAELEVYVQNSAPKVTIASLITNYTTLPAQVTLNISTKDNDEVLKTAALYENKLKIADLILTSGAATYTKELNIAGSYSYEVRVEDEAGSVGQSNTLTIQTSNITGVEDLVGLQGLVIVPNPASHELILQTAQKVLNIKLCNTLGVELLELDAQTSRHAIPQSIPNGLYILVAILEGQHKSLHKVIIER
ncbi:MAG TPA: Ig-like domain-containing protein, partial [Cytophagales bacterium]|nr:Ig-like domain-containing protein [Cytophagales bacterium]